MKPINMILKKDYYSSAPSEVSSDTRYIKLSFNDTDHDGEMSVGETFVMEEENAADGVFWRDEYTIGSTDIASPDNFLRLLQGAFQKRHVERKVTLHADSTGNKDVIFVIAPPRYISDDPEIQATFDLSDGKSSVHN